MKTMPLGLLPPSPNWYCSRASDTSQDGIFGFATKNTVFLLNIKTNPASAEGSLQGHSERVSGVSFCRTADQTQQCATSSDDCTVKVWDIKTKTVIKEHKRHQFKVTTLHWSPIVKDLIVSGDEKGALVCWDLASNECRLFIPESNHIFSLACSPHNAGHISVGYKNALVLLVDINNKGDILQRLRGHEDEIHSICWAPASRQILPSHKPSNKSNEDDNWRVDADDKSQKEEDDYFLLTGSKDRTIRVWDTVNGRTIQTLRLPPKGFQRSRDRGDDGGRGSRVWVGLWWIPNEKTSFISSSHSGDVVRWDLSGSKPRWEYLGSHEAGGINMHMRIVFNVSQGPTPDTFVTTSMDRKIICWNSSSLQADWCVSTLGGFVYCIASSPLDQSRLAIGVGDSMIRVWNTASCSQDCDVTVLWQGVKAKVTAVCWHPTRENCLAFGTDEGRVGVYNSIAQTNKPPILSSTFHRKTVYALSWGPPCSAKSGNDGALCYLYSCGGEGAILQHDPSNLSGDAVNVNKLIRDTNNIEHMLPQRTDVSWCQDGRAVAMGNEDGSIDVFAAPNLLLLCTIHVHHKLINCLKWYPLTGLSTDQSQPGSDLASQSEGSMANGGVNSNQSEQQRYWLASGSNDPHIHVYDLSNVLGPKELVQLDTPITNSMCCLSGHTLRVTALSWSPHGDSRLVSASYDGTAQVWDVLKAEPLYNYRCHIGRIFACHWSALDEDVIYTGSEDFTLRTWKTSECENKYPPKKKKEALVKTTRFQSGDAKSKKGKKQKQKKNGPAKPTEPLTKSTPTVPSEPMVDSSTKTTDQSEVNAEKSERNDANLSQSQAVLHDGKEQSSVSETGKPEGEAQTVNKMGEAESSYMEEAAEVAKEPSYLKIKKDRGKKKRQKSLFPLSCGLDNRTRAHKQADCVQLTAMKYGGAKAATESNDTENKEATHLGFFVDRKAMYDVFKEEAENHTESGGFDQKYTLGLWKGSILLELEEAKQSGTLTDMTVAMAAIGGQDVWLEICEAYAQQLEKREDFVKAANFYVACHQVHKAIQALMNNRYHREAAAIATLRLPNKDPLLLEVYGSWAIQLEKEGNFEQAAKCFITIDQPADAIRLLCKKGDPSSLRAGLEVAIFSQQETMATRLMARYVNECMLAFDWSQAQQVTSSHELLQAGQLLLFVHETMAASWVSDGVISAAWYEEPLWSPWQQVVNSAEKQVLDHISCWLTRVVVDIPLLQAAVNTWANDHQVDLSNKELLTRLYQWIDKTKPQGASQSMAMKQLLIYLSNEVLLGQLCLVMDDIYQAVLHWLQAIVTCHTMGEYDIAKALVTLILPKGRASIEELRQKISLDQTAALSTEFNQDVTGIQKKTEAVLSCLEAYYSVTVLYHLWWDFGSRTMNPANKPIQTDISHGDGANSTSKSDNVASPNENKLDDVKEPNVSHERNSVNGSSNNSVDPPDNVDPSGDDLQIGVSRTEVNTKENLTLCADTNNIASLFSKLEYISHVLLSDPHAKYAQLKHQLANIQQAVAWMVARHKMEESLQSGGTVCSTTNGDVVDGGGVDGEVTRNNEAENVSKIADASCPEDQPKSVSNLDGINLTSSGDMSATTDAASKTGVKPSDGTNLTSSSDMSATTDAASKTGAQPSEAPSSGNLLELTATLNDILKDIGDIPAEVKDHPFPEPVSSAMILVHFTKHAASVSQDDSHQHLSDLLCTVATWGHQYSITEKNKLTFSKYRVK